MDPEERREEALRPSHYLGYDRDTLGGYFMERGAFEVAETQFSRAVWLNPYEPLFTVHWAMALLRLDQPNHAREILAAVLAADPHNAAALDLWRSHWPRLQPPVATARTGAAPVSERDEP